MAQSARDVSWSAIFVDFRHSGLTYVEFSKLRRICIHSLRVMIVRLLGLFWR
jgi:hypothetical protein